jgi:hypothetical protein
VDEQSAPNDQRALNGARSGEVFVNILSCCGVSYKVGVRMVSLPHGTRVANQLCELLFRAFDEAKGAARRLQVWSGHAADLLQ